MWIHALILALVGCSPVSRDTILMIDISGSMSREVSPASTRMAVVQEATRSLVPLLLLEEEDNLTDRVGVVTFVAGAELWAPLTDIEDAGARADLDEQLETLDWCDRGYDPWDTVHGGAYFHSAPQMLGCDTHQEGGPSESPNDAGTAHRDGLLLSTEVLLDARERRRAGAIILFTDTTPRCVPHSDDCSARLYDEASEAAQAADNVGIEVHVVYFEADDFPDGAEQMCALASPDYTGSDCVTDNPRFSDYDTGSVPIDVQSIVEVLP